MVINLNKKLVTKESLLKEIDDWDIFKLYIKEDIDLKKNISSPLRTGDDRPSFGLFIGENAEICFNDFVLGKGDCIKFVMLKFGLNFFEALSKIVIDANLEHNFIIKNTFKTNVNTNSTYQSREEIIKQLNSTKLGKTSREWKLHDLTFWSQFGITKKTLELFNVTPISHIFINDKIITADKHAYCFTERKDGNVTFKIYQPFNVDYKWLNNHNESVWQGWEQLPNKKNLREFDHDYLIITKSLKDVMSIYDVCGIPAISLQAESVKPKLQIINLLKERFKTVFVLYDNDYDKETNWGREFGLKLAEEFGLVQLEINEDLESKDFSDLVKNWGKSIAKEYLENNIKEVPF